MRSTVLNQASLAVSQGRDAVQGLRSSTVATNDLAQAIRILGAELATDQGNTSSPDFRVLVEGTTRDLNPIARDEVYRIAGEAVRNAFQHARASRIEVGIQYDQRQLRLRIRDNRNGIDPKVLEAGSRAGHYGLPGLHERAKLVGGMLTVSSQPGSGTEIELTIPASTVYASTSARRSIFSSKSASRTCRPRSLANRLHGSWLQTGFAETTLRATLINKDHISSKRTSGRNNFRMPVIRPKWAGSDVGPTSQIETSWTA